MSEISEEKFQELQAIFDDCDNDNNGSICFDEFCEWWGKQ